MLASTRAVVSDSAAAAGQLGWKVSFTVREKLREAALLKELLMRVVPAAVGARMLSSKG